MAFPNPQRENRKHQLQRDLHKIAIEELAESVIEPDSWFRGNFHYHPDTEDFWRVAPRYMFDCLSKPNVMPDQEVKDLISIALQDVREKYRDGR